MKDNKVFRNNKVMESSMRQFANLDIKKITEGCSPITYGMQNKVAIPYANAHYFAWFVQVHQKRSQEQMLKDPTYQDQNEPGYINILKSDYEDAVNFYTKELEKIKFCNLEQISFELTPSSPDVQSERRYETLCLAFTVYAENVTETVYARRKELTQPTRATGGRANRKNLEQLKASYK